MSSKQQATLSEEKELPDSNTLLIQEIAKLKVHIHPPVPNPAPIGLIGFGLTTALLQMKHTRLTGEDPADLRGVDTVTMGFAMFFGGLAQFIAGLNEIQRNNIFGYTAFVLYGAFWMSLSFVLMVRKLANEPPEFNPEAWRAVLAMLTLITLMLWRLTFKLNKTLCLLFFLLLLTLILLTAGVEHKEIDIIAGYFGLITSANAFWLAYVELHNDVIGQGKELIPVFHWHSNTNKNSGAAHAPGRIFGSRASILEQLHHSNGNTTTEVPKATAALVDVECGTAKAC